MSNTATEYHTIKIQAVACGLISLAIGIMFLIIPFYCLHNAHALSKILMSMPCIWWILAGIVFLYDAKWPIKDRLREVKFLVYGTLVYEFLIAAGHVLLFIINKA